jgi:hypothetical protein
MPIIPEIGGRRQGDLEFKASLGYILRLCLKSKQNKTKRWPLIVLIAQGRN